MKQIEIKEINIWSAVKISFFMFIVIGLVIGFLFFMALTLLSHLIGSLVGPTAMNVIGSTFTAVFGFLVWLAVAIFYAVMGTIMAFIITFFYNLVARLLGGITVGIEEVAPADQGRVVSSESIQHGENTGQVRP